MEPAQLLQNFGMTGIPIEDLAIGDLSRLILFSGVRLGHYIKI